MSGRRDKGRNKIPLTIRQCWQCQAVEGQAQVDENGVLTIGAGAQGNRGRLEVAKERTAPRLSLGREKRNGRGDLYPWR